MRRLIFYVGLLVLLLGSPVYAISYGDMSSVSINGSVTKTFTGWPTTMSYNGGVDMRFINYNPSTGDLDFFITGSVKPYSWNDYYSDYKASINIEVLQSDGNNKSIYSRSQGYFDGGFVEHVKVKISPSVTLQKITVSHYGSINHYNMLWYDGIVTTIEYPLTPQSEEWQYLSTFSGGTQIYGINTENYDYKTILYSPNYANNEYSAVQLWYINPVGGGWISGWHTVFEYISAGASKVVDNAFPYGPSEPYLYYADGRGVAIYKQLKNLPPSIYLTNPSTNQTVSDSGTITISGTASDPNGDNITISATISGLIRTQTVASGSSFSLQWIGSELGQGQWSNIVVTGDDGQGGIATSTYTGNLVVDTTPPTISFSPTSGSSIYTIDSVTITASDAASSVSGLYYQWDLDSYSSTIGGTITLAPPLTGGLHTLYAYATDSNGNTSEEVPSTYLIAIPITLNTPSVFGSGYYDENALLSATGANIADAAYRIFYTTNATAPSISSGNNPGGGWTDSGVVNPMTINSSISISEIIAGTDLIDSTWTYVTFKVWVTSSTGDSAIKYTTAYSLTDNPSNVDSYIGKVSHNQILRNGTVITNPNDVVDNVYIDDDTINYRLEFDVLKASTIKDVNIILDENVYNDPDIQIQLSSILLKKGTEDPIGSGQYTYATIKDYSGLATDGPVGGTNRYAFLLGNDNDGTPIIIANGTGRYVIEYKGIIKVKYNATVTSTVIRNDAQIEIYTGSGLYPNTIEKKRPNRKFNMDTNVSKLVIQYI